MKGLVGILDTDVTYAKRLSACLSKRGELPFEVVVFSTPSAVKEYVVNHVLDVLLLGDAAWLDVLQHCAQKVVLIGDTQGEERENIPGLQRLQSVSRIARELLLIYESALRSRGRDYQQVQRIYTVYSPVRRSLRTSFSLVLAKLLSQKSRTLYLNFEDFSWVGEALYSLSMGKEKPSDLSDALYYFEQGALGEHLQQLILENHGLEYMLPVRCPEDIRQANVSQLMTLVQTVGRSGRYQNMVVDAGDGLQDPLPLLQQSQRIFVPTRGDAVSQHRLEQFTHYLVRLGQDEVIQRLHILRLPFQTGGSWGKEYLEQLFWGELGDVVKNLEL